MYEQISGLCLLFSSYFVARHNADLNLSVTESECIIRLWANGATLFSYRNISGMPWGEAENYDLVIDSSRGIEKSVEMIISAVQSSEQT